MPHEGRIRGSDDQRAHARRLLRQALLRAARELAEHAGGFESVTIRRVADRVGYTAPVVYEYFSSKRELLLAVATSGFGELADQLASANAPANSSSEQPPVATIAAIMWEFAMANPQLYQLMHTLVDVPFGTLDTPAPARRCFHLIKAAVTSQSPHHSASSLDEDAPTDQVWAQLHGLISLAINGRIKGGPVRARAILDLVARHV